MLHLIVLAAPFVSLAQSSPPVAAPTAKADPIDLHRQADALLQEADYPGATRAFRKAIEASPRNAALHYGLGCALARQRDTDAAFASLTQATSLGYVDVALPHWDPDLLYLRHEERFAELFGERARVTPATSSAIPPLPPVEVAPGALGWDFPRLSATLIHAAPDTPWIAVSTAAGGIHVLGRAAGKIQATYCAAQAPAVALTASPDGATLVSLHADRSLVLTDVRTGESRLGDVAPKPRGRQLWSRLAFVAEGERLVDWTVQSLLVWNADGTFAREIPRSSDESRWSMGSTLAGDVVPEINGSEVLLHNVLSAETPPIELTFPQPVSGAQMAPDGMSVAVGTQFGHLYVVDLEDRSTLWSGQVTDETTGSGMDLFGSPLNLPTLQFSPSGERLIACTTTGYFLAAFDVETGKRLWKSKHLGGRMGSPLPLLYSGDKVVADHGYWTFEADTGKFIGRRPSDRSYLVAALDGSRLLQHPKAVQLENGIDNKIAWRVPLSTLPPGRLEHPSGWIAGDFESTDPEADAQRFDPKRIRAGLAGIYLLPCPLGASERAATGQK